MGDCREVCRPLESPTVNGFQLGAEGPQGDELVAVLLAFLQALQELASCLTPVCCPGEEEELLRILEGQGAPGRVLKGEGCDFVDALASGGTRARKDDLANEARFVLCDHLRDEATHGECEDVDLVESQGPDE